MYYNAPDFIIRLAKDLRNNQTEAEKEIWKVIGEKKLLGFHFRRQHPANMFIVDFYYHTIRLAIDGEIHNNEEKTKET
jgi:very-short-patch-repair endonuclease